MQHTQQETDADAFGALVRDRGQVIATLGLLGETAASEAVVGAMAGGRTMFPVQLPSGPALAVRIAFGDAEVVVVRPVDQEGTLIDFVVAVPFAFDILEQILNDPYRALTVADHDASMLYISPVHERFLGLAHGGARGLPAEQAIPNSRLRAVIQSGQAEIGKTQRLANGVTRVVSRRPVWKNRKVIGAVGSVMFRDAEAVSEMAAEINQLRSRLAIYQQELRDLHASRDAMEELVGESQAMQRVRDEIARVAKLDVPVLVIGESGTGKELVARAIHRLGRPTHAMVSMNLAALPASLAESELFGHVGGAFTGSARQGRSGKLEMAHEGTLFLDEVGDIPADIQIKLLRVLEDQVVERLGSHESRRTAFRLVSATHRDMGGLIEQGAFRHDLFYRISGVTLRLPPLRHRLEDIPVLVRHFVAAFCARNGWPPVSVDPAVARYLAEQSWPGNLRQLRHRVEEALVFSGTGRLTLDAFTRNDAYRDHTPIVPPPPPPPAPGARPPVPGFPGPGTPDLQAIGRAAARQAVEACGGNKQKAALQLGISRSYLYKLLRG